MTDHADTARTFWHAIEPLHAVTYFAPEVIDAAKATGLRGFWMAYFGCRACPMGPVGPGVVEAVFANFAPSMVRRAIPDAWSYVSAETLVGVRAEAAADELRRHVPELESVAREANPLLARIVAAADGIGRPLFAANRDVDPFDDPVQQLWQYTTTLREHRGDGHVIALAAARLAGCEVHQVMAAANGLADQMFQQSRGWTDDEWVDANDRLTARGLIDADGLTEAGRALHEDVEARTDELASVAIASGLADEEVARLLECLTPAARAVASSGVIGFPNPMGLPDPTS